MVVPASVSRSPGSSTRPPGPATAAAAGRDLGAEVRPPRQRRLGVVDVVMGDQHGHALRVPRGQGGLHRGEVPGVVRTGVDEHRPPAARLADDVGVGAVQAHAARIGREHAGDLRLELHRPRHPTRRREGPAGAGIDGRGHARHRSRAPSAGARPAASLGPMRRTLAVVPHGLTVAAAVVLLTACGGSGDDDSASSSSTARSSASETERDGRRLGVLHQGRGRSSPASAPR